MFTPFPPFNVVFVTVSILANAEKHISNIGNGGGADQEINERQACLSVPRLLAKSVV